MQTPLLDKEGLGEIVSIVQSFGKLRNQQGAVDSTTGSRVYHFLLHSTTREPPLKEGNYPSEYFLNSYFYNSSGSISPTLLKIWSGR